MPRYAIGTRTFLHKKNAVTEVRRILNTAPLDGVKSRGFHVIPDNGQTVPWSYRPCFWPSQDQPFIMAALRLGILLSQRRFISDRLLGNKDPRCHCCNKPILPTQRVHAHHEPPFTFEVIAKSYLAEHGEPELRREAVFGDVIADEAVLRQWQEFHDTRARSSVVHIHCHYIADAEARAAETRYLEQAIESEITEHGSASTQ